MSIVQRIYFFTEPEGMCKPHYGNQDFSPLANGIYFIVCNHQENPIIIMELIKYLPISAGLPSFYYNNSI